MPNSLRFAYTFWTNPPSISLLTPPPTLFLSSDLKAKTEWTASFLLQECR